MKITVSCSPVLYKIHTGKYPESLYWLLQCSMYYIDINPIYSSDSIDLGF